VPRRVVEEKRLYNEKNIKDRFFYVEVKKEEKDFLI
jgi:hypothetical protein